MGKQDEFFRTQIRIPAEIHQALKDAAEESGRSMNAEIIYRLDQALSPAAAAASNIQEVQWKKASLQKQLESMEASMKSMMSEFQALRQHQVELTRLEDMLKKRQREMLGEPEDGKDADDSSKEQL